MEYELDQYCALDTVLPKHTIARNIENMSIYKSKRFQTVNRTGSSSGKGGHVVYLKMNLKQKNSVDLLCHGYIDQSKA